MGYSYSSSLSRFHGLSFRVLEGKLYYGDGPKDWIFMFQDTNGVWGTPTDVVELKSATYPLPNRLYLKYYSDIEKKCYELDTALDIKKIEHLYQDKIQKDQLFPYNNFVIGIAPFGGIAVWMRSGTKQVLLHWFKAEPTPAPGFLGEDESVMDEEEMPFTSSYIEKCMRQCDFRYIPLEEYWDGKEWISYDKNNLYYDDFDVDDVSQKCLDGTFARPANLTFLDFNKSGLPSHLAVFWHEARTAYEAYYWINSYAIIQLFDDIAQADRNTKFDVLVRIDTRANQYELAFRKADILTSLYILPPDSYELLVFRNDHQYYKSQNYNQEDGAWDW